MGTDSSVLLEIGGTSRPGAVCHVSVSGELDAETAPRLAGGLRRPRHDAARVRLDLSGITFIDCSGLTALLVELREGRQQGRELEVARDVSRSVRRLIAMTEVEPLVWPGRAGSNHRPAGVAPQRASSAQIS